jgi:hypothetical protein
MSGIRIEYGVRTARTKSGIASVLRMSSSTLAMY